ncbi:MAG: hydroxymethylbilane synthase [Sphingomonadaceae bacterium]
MTGNVMRELVVGSRGSALAMRQAQWIVDRLRADMPDLRLRIETIRTEGDVKTGAPLWQIGGRGLFVREIERALLAGEIDLAVHSMKDLPSTMEEGLVVAAVPEREDPRDVCVSRHGLSLSALPVKARVGTSSSRRRAQLLAYRPDFEIVPLRGNVDTRLRKAEGEDLDAVVLAAAGLKRLGYQDRIVEYLPTTLCLPAPGQGALALQVRSEDWDVIHLLASLDHPPSRLATEAERAFLRTMGGGCQLPLACLCYLEDGKLRMDGLAASHDGATVLRTRASGDPRDPIALGESVAGELLSRGAADLLGEVG